MSEWAAAYLRQNDCVERIAPSTADYQCNIYARIDYFELGLVEALVGKEEKRRTEHHHRHNARRKARQKPYGQQSARHQLQYPNGAHNFCRTEPTNGGIFAFEKGVLLRLGYRLREENDTNEKAQKECRFVGISHLFAQGGGGAPGTPALCFVCSVFAHSMMLFWGG